MKLKGLGWKKTLSLLICAAMLFSLCAQTALAATALEESDAVEMPQYSGGNGTETDPYKISTLADIEALRDAVNDGTSYAGYYFELTTSIDISQKYSEEQGVSWTPIGFYNFRNEDKLFAGTFDGKGHTIIGLYIDSDGNGGVSHGLFGYNAGTIQSLTVDGQAIGAGEYVYIGGVVGYNAGTIKNCTSFVTVTAAGDHCDAGGIAGRNEKGTVESCNNYGEIFTNASEIESRIGGVVGTNIKGTIQSCSSAGDVWAEGFISYAGGIVGYNSDTVQDCDSSGAVSAKVSYAGHAGGVVGDNTRDGTIQNCSNTGSILAEGTNSSRAGGIVGSNILGAVENCSNTGTVSAAKSTDNYAGGVAGFNSGPIENCSNTGAVSAAEGTANYVGGVLGHSSGPVKSCYSIGTIFAEGSEEFTGGVIGRRSSNSVNSSTIENCYYLSGTALKGIGDDNSTATAAIEEKTAEEFASGEVAYLLNNSTSDGSPVWYQRLDADPAPVLKSTDAALDCTVYPLHYVVYYPDSVGGEYAEGTLQNAYANSKFAQVKVKLPTVAENTEEDQLWFWYTDAAHSGSAVTKATATQNGENAYYAVPGYRVTLDADGGTINSGDVENYIYGIGATLPTNVTKENYTFAGWYEDSDSNGSRVTAISTTDTGNKTYWAKWTANAYTVTLHTDGGTINSGDVESYIYGIGATLPTDVTKENYTFAGWYEDSTFTGSPVTSISNTDIGDKTYWVKWTASVYTVTLNTDGGTINSGDVENYTYGVGATLPTNVTKAGYAFAGWYEDSSFTGAPITAISTTDTGNKTYWAKWTANAYSVTLDTNGGTINSGDVENYTYGVGATLPTDVTKENYTFAGWYTDSDCTGSPVTDILTTDTGDKEFYAKWLSCNTGLAAVSVRGTSCTIEGDIVTVTLPYDFALPITAQDIHITPVDGASVTAGPEETGDAITWRFTVTAEDGSTMTYTLSAALAEAPNADNAADLEEIEKLLAPDEETPWVLPGVDTDGQPVTEEALPQQLEETLAQYLEENGIGLTGVDWDITITEYIPPEAPTEDAPDGVPGHFTAAVTLSKGAEEDGTAAEITLTIEGELAPPPAEPETPDEPDKPDEPDTPAPAEEVWPAYLGAAAVVGGGTALLVYHYREALPIWKLSGTVVLADSAAGTSTPAANASVALYQNGAVVKTLTTDANGRFTARLPKGSYEAVVTWEQDGVTYAARGAVAAEHLLPDDTAGQVLVVAPAEP